MARVEIARSLEEEINKCFKGESVEVLEHLRSVADQPKKGKNLANVGGILIKELKYRNYRFYFITDGHRIAILDGDELTDLLLRFVRMSDKKHQQATIDEIKRILTVIGPSGFS